MNKVALSLLSSLSATFFVVVCLWLMSWIFHHFTSHFPIVRVALYDRMNEVQECCMAAPSMCDADRQAMLRKASDHYFEEELKKEDLRDENLNIEL